MKTTEEFRAFVNENPIASVATVEGSEPRVRNFMRVKWDDKGLLFNTGKDKDVQKQLAANPAVEVSFLSPKTNAMVRIRGKAVFVDDQALKDEVLEVFDFLKPAVEKMGYGIMCPFYIKDATASVWTMETNMQPREWVSLDI